MPRYESEQAMQWLHSQHHWAGFDGPDFFDFSSAGRQAVVAFLERVCAAMRKRDVAGHWTYSLPLHAEHVRILEGETAALAHSADVRAAA